MNDYRVRTNIMYLTFALLLLIGGCGGGNDKTQLIDRIESSSPEAPVLEVQGDTISFERVRGESHRLFSNMLKKYSQNREQSLTSRQRTELRYRSYRRTLRKSLVNQLLERAAREQGITVSDTVLQSRWDKYQQRQKGGTRESQKQIKQLKRNMILDQYIRNVLSGIQVEGDKLRDYYNRHSERFQNGKKYSFQAIRITGPQKQLRNIQRQLIKADSLPQTVQKLNGVTMERRVLSPSDNTNDTTWRTLRTLSEGEFSPPLSMRNNEFVLLFLNKSTQVPIESFQEAERWVREAYMAEQKERITREHLGDLLDRYKVRVNIDGLTPRKLVFDK